MPRRGRRSHREAKKPKKRRASEQSASDDANRKWPGLSGPEFTIPSKPHKMAKRFFKGCISQDMKSAQPADMSNHQCSSLSDFRERVFYIDTTFVCGDCGEEFVWTVAEQRHYFEVLRLDIAVVPTRCKRCRYLKRRRTSLRQEYDRAVTPAREGGTPEEKRHIVELLEQIRLAKGHWSPRMRDTFETFKRQIERAEQAAG